MRVSRALAILVLLCWGLPAIAQPCHVDEDTDVDLIDILFQFFTINQTVTGTEDPRDGDGDGDIDIHDVRYCVTQCTLSRCAIVPPNEAPSIVSSAVTTATENQVYSYAVIAIDPDNDALAYALDTAPAGMSIDTVSGLIQWLPSGAQGGSNDVAIRVEDGKGGFATQVFTVQVEVANGAPFFTSAPITSAAQGAPFAYDVDASDPDTDTLQYSLDSAPVGMGIDAATGLIEWTPASGQVGSNSVVVRVEDGRGGSAVQGFSINVAAIPVENRRPAAVDDHYSVVSGTTLTVAAPGVLDNDTDVDGDPLTAVLQAPPRNGDLTLNPDGSFGYVARHPDTPDGSRRFAVNENLSILAVPNFDPEFTDVTRGAPERSADGSLDTSWVGASATTDLYEQIFEYEGIAVREVRMFGNRQHSGFAEIAEGVVRLFNRAGVEVWNSGPIQFPAPNRDQTVLVDPVVEDVYRVQFEATAFEGTGFERLAFAEFQVFGDGFVQQLPMGLEWSWTGEGKDLPEYENVLQTPLVVDLNGDAYPEVVFAGTLRTGNTVNPGFLRAVDGRDGSEVFPTGQCVDASTTMAAGDIDGDGLPEIVASMTSRQGDTCVGNGAFGKGPRLIAFEHDGTYKWESENLDSQFVKWGGVTIADLDADGVPEILVDRQVLDNEGNHLWIGSETACRGCVPKAADIDLDGKLEVIMGWGVYEHDGTLKWPVVHTYSAIANFDEDPYAEIFVNQANAWILYEHDGTEKWRAFGGFGGGVPTVGDFDGDNEPEIGIATASEYRVLETDGSIKWRHRIFDGSSGVTGSSLFDFDNDGRMEVVQSDEEYFRIWDGATGNVRFRERVTSVTANEYPLVADIDADGEAEVVVPASFRIVEDTDELTGGVHVFGSTLGNFVRARPIWNQHAYAVTNVLEDGRIPANEKENWLLAGLNHYRVNAFLPEDESRFDKFTYKASDSDLLSDEASVFIDVTAPTAAPVITTEPVLFASVDRQYFYNAQALDPDAQPLTFSLPVAPAAMTIDAGTGLLEWVPQASDLGEHPVVVKVEDTDGLFSFQSFDLTVGQPVIVPNVVGETQSSAVTLLAAVDLNLGSVQFQNHPTITVGNIISQDPTQGQEADFQGRVNIVVSSGPGVLDTDDDGDGFTENQGDCSDTDDSIFPGANDIPGDGIDQDCDGSDATVPPAQILISPVSATVLTGELVDLAAIGIYPDNTSADVTGLVNWSTGGSVFSSAVPGVFNVMASIGAVTGSATVTVRAPVVGDATLPFAELATPAAGDRVTAPVDVIGTVSDDNFFKYTLAYARAGSSDFTVFAEGTSEVSGGVLGQLDPTLLINDQYVIRLTAFDAGGNSAFVEQSVVVDEDLKVGNFTLNFTDLAIPMSGIPITVTRTYDSRDKQKGDFGVGWRLDVQTLSISANRIQGTAWETVPAGLSTLQLVPTDVHTISLTLPNGRAELFDMAVNPSISGLGGSFGSVQVSYVPRSGTLGNLQIVGNDFVNVVGGPEEVVLVDDSNFTTFNPRRFRYIAADGSRVVLHTDNGVESVTDASGNTLTFSPSGIVHSAGKSVTFQRDGMGRITRLTDPMGNQQIYTYDANGDLVSHTDAEGLVTRYTYNFRHGLLSVTDPLDRVVSRSTYDDDGRLASITDASGRVIAFSHDVGARQEVITDPAGNVSVIEYDDSGNILRLTDALGGVNTFTYDVNGNPLTATNAAGETTTQTFDGRGNLLSRTNAAGETTTYTYNSQDRIATVTDPLGRVSSRTYDSAGRLVSETNALGIIAQSRTYDSAGNITSVTDANGNSVSHTYDAFGNRLSSTDARGNMTTTAYDANGNIVSEVDRRGFAVATTLDKNGRFTTKMDALGNMGMFDYNAAGVMARVEDALGNVTEQIVDANGRDLTFTDALGNQISKTYDILGNLESLTSFSGHTTSYEYDALSRRVRTVRPDSGAFETVYDAADRVTAETDARGNTTVFEYDLAGRNTRRIDALGNATTFAYDAVGNLVQQVDAGGNVFSFAYDDLNRLITTTFPDGTTSSTSYDAVGNVLTQTDALGKVTRFAYDVNNNLREVEQPDGATTRYTYDNEDNLLSQTDALGRTTSYTYNANGRRVSKTYPNGATETTSYDAAGRVATRTDPNGLTTIFSYDARGRVVSKSFGDGTSETFAYTAGGQVASATNATGSVSYQYDVNERLTRLTNADGSFAEFDYDLNGNRVALVTGLPGGATRTTAFTYDVLNRLSTVTDPDGGVTSHTYDTIGNLETVTYPNGVLSTYSYDALSRLSNLRHSRSGTTLAEYAYQLNAVGDRTRVDHPDGSRVVYEYDERRRLIRERHSDNFGLDTTDINYSYDAVGNRTGTVDINGTSVVYSYDSADQLLSAGSTSFTYDDNGNLQSKSAGADVSNYIFDAENQLTMVETPQGDVAFAYDATGQRVSRSAPAGTTNFLVDPGHLTGVSQSLVDYDSSGPIAEYTYGYSLISQDRSGQDAYYLSDGSRNVRLLTNALALVIDDYVYDAFGNLVDSNGATVNPYLFAGDRFGAEEGLLFLRARYYDPATGRFISRDPFEGVLRDPASLHRYLYANANPISNYDPTGQYTTLATTVVANALISISISLIADGVSGNVTWKEAAVNAVIAGGFGAIGGAAGAGLAAQATKSMTSAVASSVARKGLLSMGIIVGKAAASTLLSAAESGFTDAIGRTNGALNSSALARIFFINLALEAVTLGFAPPLEIEQTVTKTSTVTATVGSEISNSSVQQALGQSKRAENLFKRFVDSGEDAFTFLSRWGKGKSPKNLANRALANLAPKEVIFTLEEQSVNILRKSFLGAGKTFPSSDAFDYFVDAMKGAVIKVTDASPSAN